MNKKGFTLVEIIVVIILLVTVGVVSVVSVNKIKDNKELSILDENTKDFENALEIYLSNNPNVIENVNNNVKAAVVSLELLRNEGLISDKLNIDYKNNYFTLANAVLLQDETNLDSECKN